MKNLLSLCLLPAFIMACEPPTQHADPTQQYRDKKAVPAIIHDAYYEAQAWTQELPAVWKDALEKFGFKDNEIQFYTAVRTNKFVERAGNNLIILRPNFFLYLTDAEQAAYIGLQLAGLKAGDKDDIGGSHETFTEPKISSFKQNTIGLATLGLLYAYRRELQNAWPMVKNVLFSKGSAIVASCVALNKIQQLSKTRDSIKQQMAAQNMVVDRLGAEGLLTIRNKQVHWGYNNYSWLTNQWYKLLGKFDLVYCPEAALEKLKNYIEQKK